jgi:outer membrane protein OmpA-like peptidoglycan-associated protein
LDQSDISPASGLILDQVATLLKQYPFLTIELQGHTDYRASDQYNLALSKRRAIATRDYLLHQGVQPERMIIRPLGESQLKKSGNTIVEHAYNRRVEIMFYDLRGLELIFEEQDRDLQLE